MTPGYILRRLGYGVLLMVGVVVLNFLLIRLAPGDPAEVIAGEMGGATQEVLDSIRRNYGLDKPMLTQLWIYLSNIAQGDLGMSYFFDQPVSKLIGDRIGPTILLVVTAQALSIALGVAMGVIAARKPNGRCRPSSRSWRRWATRCRCSGRASCSSSSSPRWSRSSRWRG